MASLGPGDPSQLGVGEGAHHKLPHEKLEDGGRWYFSRKEIEENSPSRHDVIDLKKETYLRKSYCTFLQDLGMRLKVPQVTIATAIIFCHRFYLRQSHAKNDRRTIATACMFLAGKVEETPRPLKDVILVSYEIIHKKDPAAIQKIKQKDVYEQQKELILLEVSNQMLELYEQNRAPPNQGSEAEGSVAGGAGIRPASRTSAEEQMPNGNASQVAAATKPGSLKPPIAYQLPDQSNKHAGPLRNSQNYRAHVEPRSIEPVVHPENLGEGLRTGASADWNGSEDSKEKNNGGSKPKERIDSKDNSHTSNLEFKETLQTQSPSEIVEKIDVNKLKEIREKRKKSRSDFVRKHDPMDEYDPIMKELEEGVELAAAESEKIKHEKKQNWSQPSARLDNDSSQYSKHLEPSGDWHHIGSKARLHGSDLENVEEGEVSALDDSSWDYQSPNSTGRKRKARSPSDIISDRKPWRDGIPGDFPEDKNGIGRLSCPDRDHKRHLQENHA